nr:RecName: Full=Antioxidant protein SmP90 [Stomolophus meleagris]
NLDTPYCFYSGDYGG